MEPSVKITRVVSKTESVVRLARSPPQVFVTYHVDYATMSIGYHTQIRSLRNSRLETRHKRTPTIVILSFHDGEHKWKLAGHFHQPQ